MLKHVTHKNARWFKMNLTCHLPVWVESTRNQLDKYVKPVAYKSIGGYRELCELREYLCRVWTGIVSCEKRRFDITSSRDPGNGGWNHFERFEDDPGRPVGSDLSGVTLQFKGRHFKTLNDLSTTGAHESQYQSLRNFERFDPGDTSMSLENQAG